MILNLLIPLSLLLGADRDFFSSLLLSRDGLANRQNFFDAGWSSPPFGLPKNKIAAGRCARTLIDAGWSSPVARQAHNLKVAGSNPAPATNIFTLLQLVSRLRFKAAFLFS
jgi:hypothetical protein